MDTIESIIGEAVESTPVYFPIYSNTQLFVEMESDITWKKVNEIFLSRTFKVDLEDRHVYVNI